MVNNNENRYEKSRNLMTVRLANRIGMNKIISMANNFDINYELDDKLSMSLGLVRFL